MEIDISSLTGRLKSHSQAGQTSRSERGSNQGEKISDLPEFIPVSPRSETQVDLNSLDNHKVDYHVDQKTDELVIRIVDAESGEVVRQVPGEEFLRLTRKIKEFNQKTLDKTA